MLLLSFSEKEKLDEPKEESRNLYGFEYVNSYTLRIHWNDFTYMNSFDLRIHFNEFIYVNSYDLRIHIIRIMFSSIVHKGYFHGHGRWILKQLCNADLKVNVDKFDILRTLSEYLEVLTSNRPQSNKA